jgi:hypothetical protein
VSLSEMVAQQFFQVFTKQLVLGSGVLVLVSPNLELTVGDLVGGKYTSGGTAVG